MLTKETAHPGEFSAGAQVSSPIFTASKTPQDARRQAGYLIRRLHQVAVALFLDSARDYDITPVQYAALTAIAAYPGIDQRGVAGLIAVDRTTINIVAKRLSAKGWINRSPGAGRKLIVSLTDVGHQVVNDVGDRVKTHGDMLLAPLALKDQQKFLKLLQRLVEANNGLSRVPAHDGAVER